MIRDVMGNENYWDEFIACDLAWIAKANVMLLKTSKNPVYDPEFTFDISKRSLCIALRCYSRGDSVDSIAVYFERVLSAWEMSNKLSETVFLEYGIKNCRSWVFNLSNLNHYNWCLWLIGLALTLKISDCQWQRLLFLIGSEGEDELLDRVIASREHNRCVSKLLLHPKPYGRLLKTIDAPKEKQPLLLRDFVEYWYPELARHDENELWWYLYGDPVINPLERGYYFGRWCLEAVAAVKAFGIDDSQCLGHKHYPGDLLRPDGPTTHPVRSSSKSASWISRVLTPMKKILNRKVNYKQ